MAHDFDGEERRAPKSWSINKSISLDSLVAFVAAVASVVYSYSKLDTRVTVLEDRQQQQQIQQAVTDRRQDDDSLRYQGRIDGALKDMNVKLDRLLERSGK